MRLALALVVLLAACPGVMRPLEVPRADLRVVTLAPDGAALDLDLAVTNPNSVALNLRAIDWEVQVDDTPVARGRLDLAATIPAKASAPVRGAIAVAVTLPVGATVYVSGTMHFETSSGDVAATFDLETTL